MKIRSQTMVYDIQNANVNFLRSCSYSQTVKHTLRAVIDQNEVKVFPLLIQMLI